MATEKEMDIRLAIEKFNVSMDVKFVPFSQSRNRKEKDLSINWIVTLTRNNRSMEVEYMQGIGHLPKQIQPTFFGHKRYHEDDEIMFACEKGKVGEWRDAFGEVRPAYKEQKLLPPKLHDVLYCLVLDADVLDYSGFENWANEFGYDSDSIKDRKIYDACLKEALEFKQLFTEQEIAELHEIFQYY